MDILIILIAQSLICAGIGAYIAKEKNRGVGGWTIICFLLGVLGLIAIAAVPSLSPHPRKAEAGKLEKEFPKAKIHTYQRWKGQVTQPQIRYLTWSSFGDKSFLVVDFEQKQIVVGLQKFQEIPPIESYRMSFPFFDIVKLEIIKDGTQVVSAAPSITTGGGSVNSVLSTLRTALDGANSIAIRITVNNPDKPIHDVIFYVTKDKKESSQGNSDFDNAVQKVMTFHGYLDSAIREDGKEQKEPTENNQSVDVSEQISRLWQLKQEGALTQEEFEKQKAKLLQS